MKHTTFDAQIKSTLEQMETPYEPASWDLLRQKMDQTFIEEHPEAVGEVDKAVFHKLQNLEMAFQPSHWDMLATKMTNTLQLRRRIWISKIAEVAIFLLLLLNMDGLIHMSGSERMRPSTRPKSNRPQVDIPTKNLKHHAYATIAGQSSETPDLAENVLLIEPVELSGEAINDLLESRSSVFSDLVSAHPEIASSVLMNDVPVQYVNGFAIFTSLPIPKTPLAKFTGMFKTPIFPVKNLRTNKMYAATFVTFNHNMIHSEGDSRTANGYGGGIAVGYRNGKWGVEAGLAYTQTNYNPKKDIKIYASNPQSGYVGTYAHQVDADLFSIPVKATRKLGQTRQVSMYAVAGVTANVTVQKSYRYKTVEYATAPSTQPVVDPQSRPQFTQQGNGLLEKNGKLPGNFYATADAGLRFERPVGKRLTAFVEPTYHQSLSNSGIGPKSNRINTLALNAGIIASL